MPFLRNLAKDLVEKRLWPVAVLLVAALVAVPVLIGRTSPDPVAPAGVAGTAATADAGSSDDATRVLVSIDEDAADRRHEGGDVRDPFKAPAAAKAASETETTDASTVTATEDTSTSGATTPADTTTGGATTSGGSTGSTGSTGSSSGSGDAKAKSTFHVSLRFGTTGEQKTIRDIARLSPLPSVTNPFFVYLGVLADGKTAVFMVSSDAVPTGDGSCKPSATDCQTIHLKAGDTEWFDFTNPDGSVVQYQMDLVSVRKKKVTSVDAVQAAHARHSRVGAELLRDAAVHAAAASKGARSYRYLPKRGVLVRAKKRKRAATTAVAGALVPGAAEVVALAPRKQQPGIPVWHWDAGKAERR
jgi:hypothetical protein